MNKSLTYVMTLNLDSADGMISMRTENKCSVTYHYSIQSLLKSTYPFTGVYPELTVPSRRSVGRHISELATNVHTTLKEKLAAQDYLCTTADIWSTKHRSFMGITVHWVCTN